jgi:S-DNA-T family DNA segregation ATPase FtsK/SpoIIIE
MAVRIALQCSEADGHLILSKDNSAARLLTRPGEAIYNAANGLVEGNSIFQVVWLPEERRDAYLERVTELARERGAALASGTLATPQIVFEGTAPSDLTKNPYLLAALKNGPAPATAWTAWLGEAIAIKDPTAAVFRKQSGANLLLIGQQPETAFHLLAASACGLATQITSGNEPSIYLVPGTPLEGDGKEVLTRLAEALGPTLKTVTSRGLPAVIASLSEEMERRAKQSEPVEPVFLLLYGLHRLRDLRREEDFGLSRRGEDKPSPAKLFANLLREGPPLGIHVIAWCDNLNNLNRALDRQMLREFEMRVLFQMSAADSSNLIDSPVAAKLGPHRALYYTEEQGRVEKFRPYGPPAAEWLAWLQAQREKNQARTVGSGLE